MFRPKSRSYYLVLLIPFLLFPASVRYMRSPDHVVTASSAVRDENTGEGGWCYEPRD